MKKKKLIYISGKYKGKEEYKQKFETVIKGLVELEKERTNNKEYDYVFISPIHAFGFLYDEVSYEEGIEYCLALLDRCDEIWMMDNWEESKGACIEFGYAKARGIHIEYI